MLCVKDFRFTADSSCSRISFFTEELPLRPNTGPHYINSLLMIADSRFLHSSLPTQCHFTLLCNSDPGGGLLWIVKSHGLVTVLSTPLPFFGDSLGQFLWVNQLRSAAHPSPVACHYWNLYCHLCFLKWNVHSPSFSSLLVPLALDLFNCTVSEAFPDWSSFCDCMSSALIYSLWLALSYLCK